MVGIFHGELLNNQMVFFWIDRFVMSSIFFCGYVRVFTASRCMSLSSFRWSITRTLHRGYPQDVGLFGCGITMNHQPRPRRYSCGGTGCGIFLWDLINCGRVGSSWKFNAVSVSLSHGDYEKTLAALEKSYWAPSGQGLQIEMSRPSFSHCENNYAV